MRLILSGNYAADGHPMGGVRREAFVGHCCSCGRFCRGRRQQLFFISERGFFFSFFPTHKKKGRREGGEKRKEKRKKKKGKEKGKERKRKEKVEKRKREKGKGKGKGKEGKEKRKKGKKEKRKKEKKKKKKRYSTSCAASPGVCCCTPASKRMHSVSLLNYFWLPHLHRFGIIDA